jgi:hypothetical protein
VVQYRHIHLYNTTRKGSSAGEPHPEPCQGEITVVWRVNLDWTQCVRGILIAAVSYIALRSNSWHQNAIYCNDVVAKDCFIYIGKNENT